ncbi:MAG: IS3 family transposase, partial [Gammaproteobacteria bacterium]
MEIHHSSKSRYGSPRIHEVLKKQSEVFGRKRIVRLMNEANIHAKGKRKFKSTTDLAHHYGISDNLVNQPNHIWAGDIMYVRTQEGWLYLAIVIDLYSRKVIGWAMDKRMTRQLVIDALLRAYWLRKLNSTVIHHSNRGSQYVSGEFQEKLATLNMVCSKSGKGNCYDNSVVESFFHTLKVELVHGENFVTRQQAKSEIFQY